MCMYLWNPSAAFKKYETFYIKHHKTWTYSTLICNTWCFTQPTPHTYFHPCQGHVGYRRATSGSGLDEVVLMGRAWCNQSRAEWQMVFLPISCLSSCCYQNLFRFFVGHFGSEKVVFHKKMIPQLFGVEFSGGWPKHQIRETSQWVLDS